MDIKALQLASRFSLPTNTLGYCGKDTAQAKLKSCIVSRKCEGVEEELSKFIVVNPYLETISKITGLPKFSYNVIESYWLGNEQLKKAKPKHYGLLLENFAKQGVPDWLINELKQKQPKKFIPNHLFQVLHVGVGKASGSVPFNLETINNCMIRWGNVEKIAHGKAIVKLNSLKKEKNTYKLTVSKETLSFDLDFVPGLKVGDTVAVHWKQIVKILTADEEKNLSFWTKEVLKSQHPTPLINFE